MPLVTGLAAAFVAHGRWRVAPHGGARAPHMLRSAGDT